MPNIYNNLFENPKVAILSVRPMKGIKSISLIQSGAANNEMPPPVFDEKGIRLEFAQFGHFDSFEVFRSLTSMAALADHELPAPIATGLKTMRFIDQINLKSVLDRDLYYRVRVIRDNQSLLSDELQTYISTFSAPQNLIVAFSNNALEIEWDFESVTELHYYCSESPIDINSLPAPKAVIAGNVRTYVDTAIELGKTYHVVVGSVKNGVEKLSSEIKVLAGIPWTPASLLTLTTLIADNSIIDSFSRISQITDASGNARHAVQTSDVRKPILASINSQKALQFDGSNDFLWISDTSYLKAQNFLWVFWVGEPVFKTGYTSVFYSIYRQNSASKMNFSLNSGKPAFGGRRVVSDSYAEVASTVAISSKASINFGQRDFTTKTAILFNNGLQTAINNNVGTAGTADSSELCGSVLGAYVTALDGSNFSESYIGKLGCVIVGSGILSEVNRQKLEGWAAHKYGLTANLPAGHPYKILVPII